ncbi:hypothetical protein ES702_06207 [subsurface metagenome]
MKKIRFGVQLTIKQYINFENDIHAIELIDYFESCIGLDQLIETSGFFHENLKLFIEKKLRKLK